LTVLAVGHRGTANAPLFPSGAPDERRPVKKVRAVLKLVRHQLGTKTYRRENGRFRGAGRPLTAVRDARVLVQTFDDVGDLFGNRPDPPLAAARAALAANNEEVKRRVLQTEGAAATVAGAVRGGRRRVCRWDLAGGWSVVGPGLRRG
jgi:hypothetical protein